MRKHCFAALIVSFVVAAGVFGAVKEQKMQLKWEELAEVVQGKKVQMILRSGEEVEGKVQSVQPQALEVKVSGGSASYEKGLHLIPRSQVSVLRYEGRSGPWRGLGTAIGAGGGAAAGIAIYTYFNNEADPEKGTAIAAGLIGGGAALGYLVGRSADRRAFVISIIE